MLVYMVNDEVGLVNPSLECNVWHVYLLVVIYSNSVLPRGHTESLAVICIKKRKDAVLSILCG